MTVAIGFVSLAIAGVVAAGVAPAAATTLPVSIGDRTLQEFALPAIEFVPQQIAIDGAGNVWVADAGTKLIELRADGSFRHVTVPTSGSEIQKLAVADDGTVWFTETRTYDGSHNFVGHVAAGGGMTMYALPRANASLDAIVPAAGGGVWVGESGTNRIARVTRDGAIGEYRAPGSSEESIRSLVTDVDGSLWIARDHAVVHLLRNGRVERFRIASPQPGDGIRNMVRAGPQSFWLTLYAQHGELPSIWRFTPSTGMTAVTIPSSSLGTTLLVPDRAGGAWFPVLDGNAIGHIDTTGTIRLYSLPLRGSDIMGMALDRSGNLLFANMQSEKIGFFGRGTPSPQPVIPALRVRAREIIRSWRRQLQPRDAYTMSDVTADTLRIAGAYAVVGWSDLDGNAASLLRNEGGRWQIVATRNGNFYQPNELTDRGVPPPIATRLLDEANVQLVPQADQ